MKEEEGQLVKRDNIICKRVEELTMDSFGWGETIMERSQMLGHIKLTLEIEFTVRVSLILFQIWSSFAT